MLPEAAMPSPPCSAPPISVMMSPNKLLVTITWYWAGILHQEHRQRIDVLVRGRNAKMSAATARKTRCQSACPCGMALLLSAMQTLVRPWEAVYSRHGGRSGEDRRR